MALTFHKVAHLFRFFVMSHFLLEWLLLLVLITVCSVWISGRLHSFDCVSQEERSAGRTRSVWCSTPTDWILAMAFVLFTALYVVIIFYKEDFCYYDDDQLTDFSLQGRMFPPWIMPDMGRFVPIWLQEFNILALITKSPAGFHSFAVTQLVVLVLVLFAVFKELKFFYRVLTALAVMLVPSVVISFTGLMPCERNILFWLAILVLCIHSYSRTKAPIYFAGCLIATQFALYYKETFIVFVAAYALTRILLEGYVRRYASVSWSQLASATALPLGMLILSCIYTIFFLLALFPFHLSYVSANRGALGSALLTYLQSDWLPFILLIVVAIRFQRFISAGEELDLMWDPLAVGALAYALVVIAVGIVSGYYLAPVDFIAILYLARISSSWLSNARKVRAAIVAAVFACVMFHNIAYSVFRIVDRKGVIAAKTRFGEFLNQYFVTSKAEEVHLFFPYTKGPYLMRLSAYLSYKGFQVEREGTPSEVGGHRVLIEGRQVFPSNRCAEWKDYICTHLDRPQDGALIVILPDDNASLSDVENVSKNSKLLLSYDLCQECSKDGSWLRYLHDSSHAISPEVLDSKLPDHWLKLDVFERRAGSDRDTNLSNLSGNVREMRSVPSYSFWTPESVQLMLAADQ